jgi:hypothetical protein
MLNKFAMLIEENMPYLSALESLDSGKPFSNAAYSAQVWYTCRPLRYVVSNCHSLHTVCTRPLPSACLCTALPYIPHTLYRPQVDLGLVIKCYRYYAGLPPNLQSN